MEEIQLSNQNEISPRTPNKKGVWIRVIGFAILFIVIIAVVCGLSGECSSSTSYLTYSNYSKIQTGMTYSQVVEILDNHQGTLDTSSSYGGYTLSYYTWSNSSGTKCIVVGFENSKVCAKSQYGLG